MVAGDRVDLQGFEGAIAQYGARCVSDLNLKHVVERGSGIGGADDDLGMLRRAGAEGKGGGDGRLTYAALPDGQRERRVHFGPRGRLEAHGGSARGGGVAREFLPRESVPPKIEQGCGSEHRSAGILSAPDFQAGEIPGKELSRRA